MLERFRKEAATGRVLACATTNLDFGTFRPFDVLEGVKLDNAAFRESMMQRLIASSSIPAVFPPVEIDGSYYVDGGATENVWSIRNQTEQGTPISEWRKRYPDKPLPRIRLWYLINNQFFPKTPDVKLQWIDIASAGLSTSLRSALIKDLNLSAYAAAAENAQVPGEVEERLGAHVGATTVDVNDGVDGRRDRRVTRAQRRRGLALERGEPQRVVPLGAKDEPHRARAQAARHGGRCGSRSRAAAGRASRDRSMRRRSSTRSS
jgi:hypothetical protein